MRHTITAFCTVLSIAALAPEARADEPVTIRSPSELTAGVVTATLGGVSLDAGIIAAVGGIWMALEGGHRTHPRWSLSPVGFATTF